MDQQELTDIELKLSTRDKTKRAFRVTVSSLKTGDGISVCGGQIMDVRFLVEPCDKDSLGAVVVWDFQGDQIDICARLRAAGRVDVLVPQSHLDDLGKDWARGVVRIALNSVLQE